MSLASDDPRHGTDNAYTNLGCRCQPCRDDHARVQSALQDNRSVRRILGLKEPVHGRYTTYCNWRCRCRECTSAWAAYNRHRYRKVSS